MNLNLGRELDKIVAEKVMGWTWNDVSAWSPSGSKNRRYNSEGDYFWWLPYYSADIEAAWEVINKLIERKHLRTSFSIQFNDDGNWSKKWLVIIQEYYKSNGKMLKSTAANGDTAPNAICIAALKSVGVIRDE